MTNGWPAPASHELGANWVEVTVWERCQGNSTRKGMFENVASNNLVDFVPALLMSTPWFPGRCCFPEFGEAAGVGQPFEEIFDFQSPMAID